MGWTSIDDFVNEVTVNGKFWRQDWQKVYQQAAATAGRWYDLSLSAGNPPQFGYGGWNTAAAPAAPYCGGYGEMIKNGGFQGGANYWTLSDVGWLWAANTMTKVNAGAAGTLISTGMQKTPVAARTYRVIWTISVWGGVGNITCSLGGTASASPRSSAATFVETIIATDGTALTFTPSAAAVTATITYISVVELLQSFTMDDTLQGAMYTGGAVAGGGSTKHLINAGCVTSTATTAPSTLILVDLLMCYPGINLASSTLQTFLNDNALTRYTNGAGVRAFMVTNTKAGAATPNIFLTYTNTTGDATRTLPNLPALLTASPLQHIPHSGVLAGNFGPFLPWSINDIGMTNAINIKLSTNMGAVGEACLMLCKPLATIPITTQYIEAERDYFNQLPSLPKIVDGACLGLLLFAGAAVPNPGTFMGYFDFAWG